MNVLVVDSVIKHYGAKLAVDRVSFEIARGESVALLGPNGAGKTTTLDMIVGLRRPDSGRVRLFGADPRSVSVRAHFGSIPQETGVPLPLRVREIVAFVAAHYPHPASVDSILEAFELTAYAKRQAGALSGGELRRLGLALAFVGNPEFVVLDEPTTGLDLESRRRAWEHIAAYVACGGTLLLTTHYMEEAERLASRVVLLDRGSVIRDATSAQLRTNAQQQRLAYIGDPFDPRAYGIEASVERDGERVIVTTGDADAVVRAIVMGSISFRDLQISRASLEDALLALKGESQ